MLHLAFLAAANLVPLVGVLYLGWNAATIVALFWVETLIHGTANAARIAGHRWWNPEAHHDRPFFGRSTKPKSYLRSYAIFFYWFTLGHGIMLIAVLEGLSRDAPGEGLVFGVDPGGFGRAAAALAVLALAELGLDLATMAGRPFSWLERRVSRSNARIVVLHVAILAGAVLIGAFETTTSLLVALIAVKMASDLGAAARSARAVDEVS